MPAFRTLLPFILCLNTAYLRQTVFRCLCGSKVFSSGFVFRSRSTKRCPAGIPINIRLDCVPLAEASQGLLRQR